MKTILCVECSAQADLFFTLCISFVFHASHTHPRDLSDVVLCSSLCLHTVRVSQILVRALGARWPSTVLNFGPLQRSVGWPACSTVEFDAWPHNQHG